MSGERTPYNNPTMTGEFTGLTASTRRADMTYAVLEGIAFAFKNGLEVMHEAGVFPSEIAVIGGGARSEFWRQLIADTLGVAITYRAGGDVGPALGAARLAQMAVNPNAPVDSICSAPTVLASHLPRVEQNEIHNQRFKTFLALSNNNHQRRMLEK